MRWIHFASQHLGVITLFWCLCEITQSNNSNGAPQSLFALFAVWCCQPASQPASQTDCLPTIDLDDPSDESMNGWLAGWLAKWW